MTEANKLSTGPFDPCCEIKFKQQHLHGRGGQVKLGDELIDLDGR
jgi:hypothetical protein